MKTILKRLKLGFVYTPDKKTFVDHWSVMRNRQGNFHGDCDDYAVTVLYHSLGFWRFLWHVLVTKKARLIRVRTKDGGSHIVGNLDGWWFDNFVCGKRLARHVFFSRTGHRWVGEVGRWERLVKLTVGLFYR